MKNTLPRTFLTFALTTASLAGPVLAKDCSQDHAIYEDASHEYSITFQTPSEASAVSHLFSVSIAKSKAIMDGNVQLTEDVPRTLGTVLFQCPEGDVTGADLEACTIWQGLIYSVDPQGKVENLASGSNPAASQLLLADFGAALRISKLWADKKATIAPYDTFQLKECRP